MWWLFGLGSVLAALAHKKVDSMATTKKGPESYPSVVFPQEILGAMVNNALRTIRTMESRGNYQIESKYSSASGAYQFLDTTWNGYGGFKRAKDAPPGVQDAKARQNVVAILAKHGNDFKWIPAVWYVGNAGATNLDWDKVAAPQAGNKSTILQYVTNWMNVFNKGLQQPGTGPIVV